MKIVKCGENSKGLSDISTNKYLDIVVKIYKKPELWIPPLYSNIEDFDTIDISVGFLELTTMKYEMIIMF